MGLGAILCPDRIGQPAPPSFHPQNRLTGLMVIAHFNLHAEHNWFPTCCIADFQSARCGSELLAYRKSAIRRTGSLRDGTGEVQDPKARILILPPTWAPAGGAPVSDPAVPSQDRAMLP